MNFGDTYSDALLAEGYTTVFYVAGGNIMHILNSCRNRFQCIPVIHEVSAVIAAEYFNETSTGAKAFALVTAGPGLTNCVTGIAGAWLESRSVLIIGGQVKSQDLLTNLGIRQNGIQEIDGVAIVKSICNYSVRIDSPLPVQDFVKAVRKVEIGRPGPVFIELCLDVQATPNPLSSPQSEIDIPHLLEISQSGQVQYLDSLKDLLESAERPVILLGGGVSRLVANRYLPFLEGLGIPIMTTWNASDRIDSDSPLFFGRPNTWGQRSANIILQQSDLLIAIGTRLGIQQTGFNWQEFVPAGKIVQVDIDENELKKGHPNVELPICSTSEKFLMHFKELSSSMSKDLSTWLDFAGIVRELCPLSDDQNSSHEGFVNPYNFVMELSTVLDPKSIVIPCSSGGAFTTMMQAFNQKLGQKIVTNKGLASMGYGLSGAIGSAIANPDSNVVLVEGDGGFSQNLQDIGTVIVNQLNLKIFLYSNEGYASIRMTQKNYFGGAYMGCDTTTGLGLPDWSKLFDAFSFPSMTLGPSDIDSTDFQEWVNRPGPMAFIIPIHPEQTYFPKITSSITSNGQMVSNPLHLMMPQLPEEISKLVFRYI
ncbi:thiamine pyrophosphate-binding protein [Candidatus Planktophila dulcis]|uniref:thiamine pyrophosphate-binding protein n=1 Tax=Candidatus Planktophila dulcis TaxID=1884914 RepID=UPI003CED374E